MWVKESGPQACSSSCTMRVMTDDDITGRETGRDKCVSVSKQWVSDSSESYKERIGDVCRDMDKFFHGACNFVDALISELAGRPGVLEQNESYDPILSNEVDVRCASVDSSVLNQNCSPCPDAFGSLRMAGLDATVEVSKRPRGRPKKSILPPCVAMPAVQVPVTIENACFDPMTSVECYRNMYTLDCSGLNDDPRPCVSSLLANDVPYKKPHGRPKKVACSLPDPLFVPSTLSRSSLEAHETWNTAKLLGVKSSNEEAVIAELRKSKRLMVLEENNPAVG